ncbi:MAG: HEAT repeat domain-containing protein [Candidatus Sulfopaludibacter sp.]|nr:HEAT repeat domain-containing protein [Candidatus Sulfopaludibacter sp.]
MRRTAVALLWAALLPAQSTPGLLARFDREHDLAAKERLLRAITEDPGAGPALLRLAKSTANTETRWMAMRGMATLHYTAAAPFLEASLTSPEVYVRANAARALGDLKIREASTPLLAMFAAEQEPPAIQQASLALRMLEVRAAAPLIRERIPRFPGQTRAWLIQALGALGNRADVPTVAAYLDERGTNIAATEAIQELAGVDFGPRPMGLAGDPPPSTLAAQAWWKAHKDEWPH